MTPRKIADASETSYVQVAYVAGVQRGGRGEVECEREA